MKIIFSVLIFVFTAFPSLAQKHVFYLHGKIIENMGPEAVETANGYGAYKYQDILDSLETLGFTVISEARPKDTDVNEYAKKVVTQINELLKKGVAGKNITVIGASKGAVIAMYVSSLLKNETVNYVFLAACNDYLLENDPELFYYGNILSIYEKSDGPGSCNKFKERSKSVKHYKEIELNTGLKHGFLYRPIPEWLNPSVNWARGDYK